MTDPNVLVANIITKSIIFVTIAGIFFGVRALYEWLFGKLRTQANE